MIKALVMSALLIFGCLSVYTQPRISPGVYELKDTVTKNRYILDSAHIVITALSAGNDTLWQTDPWKDNLKHNRFPYYRMDSGKRPVVVLMNLTDTSYFSQFIPRIDSKIPGIAIGYNNSQFGVILCENGKYKFLGQD